MRPKWNIGDNAMNIPAYSINQNDQFYQELLSTTLQQGLSDNGWTTPPLSTDDIMSVLDQMPDGTIWYNTTVGSPVIKQGGSLMKISTEAL